MSDDRHGGALGKGGMFERSREIQETRTGVSDAAQGKPSIPFEPTGTWLVVEMEGARDKTFSGRLYVPDTAKDAPSVGVVLAVGPGERRPEYDHNHDPDDGASEYIFGRDPNVSKVGDRILFQKYAGSEIDWHDGKTYLFVKESDVVAYVKE